MINDTQRLVNSNDKSDGTQAQWKHVSKQHQNYIVVHILQFKRSSFDHSRRLARNVWNLVARSVT